MGINRYNLHKWLNMLRGKSTLHVKQGIGKIYSVENVKGYYSDLTSKVYNEKNIVDSIPMFLNKNGQLTEFSIMIFQYGLGAYDLYLTGIDVENNLNIFRKVLDWAVRNQENNGAWITFKDAKNQYSAMAQGEGISLLIRGYIEFHEDRYIKSAQKAINFLMDMNNGIIYVNKQEIFLKEHAEYPVILNGWIFSIWGIYDYLKISNDEDIKEFYNNTLRTLVEYLPNFDNGYWSKYCIGKTIASPFYHDLHINQLKVMFNITKEDIFKIYADKFECYEKKWINRKRAFIVKAFQKVMEK